VCCGLSETYGWKDIKLIKGRTSFIKEKGFGRIILKKFPDQYRISFEFYPKKNGGKWGNVLHLTPGGKKASPFNRHIVTVFYHDGNQELLLVTADKTGPHTHTIKGLRPNRWHSVLITQERKANGVYLNNIIVNGKRQASQFMRGAEKNSAVAVFTGAPWYQIAEGFIQKLSVSFKTLE